MAKTGVFFRSLALFVLLALLPLQAVQAARVEQLYMALEPVESQSSAELDRAMSAALGQVLIKVSGSRAVLQDPAIQAAIRKPRDYLRQFSYTRQLNKLGDKQQFLKAEFQPSLVSDLLRRYGQPVWSNIRPSMVAWVVIDQQQQRELLRGSSDAAEQLLRAAKGRGLPVQLPLGDLEDSVALSLDDIWGQDLLRLFKASERYHTDGVLAVRVYVAGGGRILGTWVFAFQGQEWQLEGRGDSLEDFFQQGIDQLADRLAEQYAVRAEAGANEEGLTVEVHGLDTFRKYHASNEYLKSLVAVQGLKIVRVRGSQVNYVLKLDGSLTQLEKQLQLGKRLRVLPFRPQQDDGAEDNDPPSELYLEWRG